MYGFEEYDNKDVSFYPPLIFAKGFKKFILTGLMCKNLCCVLAVTLTKSSNRNMRSHTFNPYFLAANRWTLFVYAKFVCNIFDKKIKKN